MPKTKSRTPPKPGSTFRRTYKGNTYSLSVVEQNERIVYRLNGKTFSSPSAAAKSLSHYEVNGWAFWDMNSEGGQRVSAGIKHSRLRRF